MIIMIELKVTILKTFAKKTKGLLGAKKAYPVLFKTRFGIHTFGLTFPLDVLILDRENCIVKLAINLKPMNIFLWHPVYDTVIELPAGTIKKCKLSVGDTIFPTPEI